MNNHYLLMKDQKVEQIVFIDYKKLDGFHIKPRNSVEYEGVVVNKLLVIKPSFIEKLLKRKVKRKLESYLQYIINILDEDDSDSNLNSVLTDLKRYRGIIEYNYRKYLDEKYIELLLRKISLLEYELKSKMFSVQQSKYRNNFDFEEKQRKSR